MAQKKSFITVTDQFCGAGGSSQGVRNLGIKYGGGIEVKMALNHWKLAIETHNTNFPDTLHDCTDISACDPRRYPSTDILITSPECTTHSPAGGNRHKEVKTQIDLFDSAKIDPATERSRATMWDVCRFAEYHKYNIIIVENVVEAKTRWSLFDNWLGAMHTLGYNHKCVYLNSMHCIPTPQSRDRMYIVFWKIGNKAPMLEYMPNAYCPKCEKDVSAVQTWKNSEKKFGKYNQQYVYCCPADGAIVEPYYFAAFNIIDWSNVGQRIGDRKKPLCANSTKRIDFGIKKYGKAPYIFHAAYSDKARGVVKSIADPAFCQTTFASQAIIQQPFIVNDQHSTGIDFRVKSAFDKLPTIATDNNLKIVTSPFIIKGEHTLSDGMVRSAFGTMQTQTTRQTQSIVTPPFLVDGNFDAKPSRTADLSKPIHTNTAQLRTGLVTNDSWNSFIAYNYNGTQTSHITEAADTVGTKDKMSLVTYKEPQIEDCYYRMLMPKEVKLAMAFDKDYTILGSGKDQVKQCGNAVTPPAMEWIVKQCVESLN